MIDHGRFDVCGIPVSAVDYEACLSKIIPAAQQQRPLSVSALAVHGVMTGVLDREHRQRLQSLDLVVPDGQPVRWAMNLLHGQKLSQRVYGPELTLRTCAAAEREGISVYFYGSRSEVLDSLLKNLKQKFPRLEVAGVRTSRFRKLSTDENDDMIQRIRQSGAGIVFVGLGCPRQEVWAFENTKQLAMPVLAVGAAFDFHAGLLSQAPNWMQARGLEWFYRLSKEPRRLWRRYLYLNPLFCIAVARQYLAKGKQSPDSRSGQDATPTPMRYG